MKYCIRSESIMHFTAKCMELEDILLTEVSQKDNYRIEQLNIAFIIIA